MSRIRAYIKPFNSMGQYQADFIEVTDDLEKISDITFDTDSGGYDIGVYRNSGLSISLNNSEGKYANVGTHNTIFGYTRNNSLVKITYDRSNELLTPVIADSMFNQFISDEVVLFEGLLNDDSLVEDARQASATFKVIGFEILFSQEKTNYSELVLGDNIEEVLYKLLNVAKITNLLTVSASNISVGLNQVLDSIESIFDKNIKPVLDDLLLLSNSILYIENRTVYIVPRTAGVAIQKTFYGPQSANGVENIKDIKNVTSGNNKIFNFFSWSDSTQTAARNQSIRKYGRKTKNLSSDLFTNTNKQFNVMESLLDEFGFPKQELDLVTHLDYDTYSIQILDRVNIDYPLQVVEAEGFELPICGIAICGEAVLPKMIFAFSMNTSKNFKVIRRTFHPEKREMTFRLREV